MILISKLIGLSKKGTISHLIVKYINTYFF